MAKGTGGGRTVAQPMTLADADELWFDYDQAFLIKEAQRGELRVGHTFYGQGWRATAEDAARANAAARLLSKAAEQGDSGHRVLYRGMTLSGDNDVTQLFRKGRVITTDNMWSASPNRQIAEQFSDLQYAGGEGVSIMVRLESGRGNLRGFARADGGEVILPQGARYVVSSVNKTGPTEYSVVLYGKRGG